MAICLMAFLKFSFDFMSSFIDLESIATILSLSGGSDYKAKKRKIYNVKKSKSILVYKIEN